MRIARLVDNDQCATLALARS